MQSHGNQNRDPSRKQKFTETFESSLPDSRVEKFILEKTLYQGIKENDVAKIIDIGKDGGGIDEKQLDDEGELAAIVIETRKKYDEFKTNSNKVEAEIEKQRKQIDLLKAEETKYQDLINSTKSNFSQVEKQSQEMASMVEARVYDFDIYKQMLDTLKKDILIFKKRNFDRDLLLRKDRTRLKSLRTDEFNKTRLSYRCKDMLQSVEKTVIGKERERTTKIQSFYDVLGKKHEGVIRREQRERDIEEVMMRAMSEKLQEEKEWINICNTNIFLKKFLKLKMERIIALNHTAETAFHKIKISTDISDSRDFISRFLNREKHYGTLLESISSKEAILQTLKEQKERLETLNKDYLLQSEQISEMGNRSESQPIYQPKQIVTLEQVKKVIEQQKQLIYRWAIKFQCASNSKNREDLTKKYPRIALKQLLSDTLKEINNFITRLLSEEMLQRNNRVKTMSAYEEPGASSALDERDMPYDDISEADFLQYNRKITKKNDLSRRFRIKTKPN